MLLDFISPSQSDGHSKTKRWSSNVLFTQHNIVMISLSVIQRYFFPSVKPSSLPLFVASGFVNTTRQNEIFHSCRVILILYSTKTTSIYVYACNKISEQFSAHWKVAA